MKTAKKSILLRAPMLSMSGYGVHSRQVARWLFDRADASGNLDITTELLNWGGTPWLTDVYAHEGLVGRCFQASSNVKEKYDVTIQLQLPNEWCPELGKFNIGMTAGVEATRCNPAWIECVNQMDLVVVPSEFTKQVFLNSGHVTTKILVVRESFFDEVLSYDTAEPLDLDLETKFNFLVFGQVTGGDAASDRKNLPFTLKWLFEAFGNHPDVGIILKTNMGRFTEADKHVCKQSLTRLLQEAGKAENPKFHLLHGEMSEKELVRLYKNPTIKALVTLTHGEGFGLPILESAACGVPVIGTNWSAHPEFLNLGMFVKVDTTLGAVPASRIDGSIWMQGSEWGMANEQDFKKKVLKFYESSSTPKKIAMDSRKNFLEKYSFKAIAKLYDSVFGDLLI